MEDFLRAKNLIINSQNILINLPQEMDGDDFGGSLALFYTLKKIGKKANFISPRFPEKLKFLVNENLLENESQNSVVISVNTKRGKINKIYYEKDDKELKFYLSLKEGEIEIKNISLQTEKAIPDLSIIIDNKKIFFEPTQFCDQNLILQNPLNNVSGIIKELLGLFEEDLIEGDIATCLLAGQSSFTQNFQNGKTSPKTLEEASLLIQKGADYQKVIKYFYKTKSLAEVKLLSQVLSKMNFDKEKEIAWCSLSKEDFETSKSSSTDLSFVFEALKSNFSLPKTIFVLWQSYYSSILIKGIFYSVDNNLVKKISSNFESIEKGNGVLFLVRNLELNTAEKKILEIIT